MSRDEAKGLATVLVLTVTITVLLLAVTGIRNKAASESKEPAVACGHLVESREIARQWRLDCGIFPDYGSPPSRPGLSGPGNVAAPPQFV
jgi:hypothetical protein